MEKNLLLSHMHPKPTPKVLKIIKGSWVTFRGLIWKSNGTT